MARYPSSRKISSLLTSTGSDVQRKLRALKRHYIVRSDCAKHERTIGNKSIVHLTYTHLPNYHVASIPASRLSTSTQQPPPDSSNERSVLKASDISPEQRRAADLELANMKRSTARILSLPPMNEMNESTVNELRVNLHYWISRWHVRFHPGSVVSSPTSPNDGGAPSRAGVVYGMDERDESRYSDYGVRQASRLLDHILGGRTDTVKRVLGTNGNVILVNLVSACLAPCRFAGDLQSYDPDGSDGVDGYIEGIDLFEGKLAEGSLLTSNKTTVRPSTWKPAIFHAARILDIIDQLHKDPNNSLKPNVFTSNVVLNIGLKLSMLLNHYQHTIDDELPEGNGDRKGVSSFSQGFNDVHHINTSVTPIINWNNVDPKHDVPSLLRHISTADDIIDRMEEQLAQMEDCYFSTQDETIRPDVYSYNLVMAACARHKRGLDRGINEIETRSTNKNDVGSRWEDGVSRCEWYLRRMENTYDRDMGLPFDCDKNHFEREANRLSDLPSTAIYPDVTSYNIVLNAYASSPQISHHQIHPAETLLQRMERRHTRHATTTTINNNAQPNTISYSTVLHSIASESSPHAAQRCEDLLDKIVALSRDPGHSHCVQPNSHCFNTAIDAWARSCIPSGCTAVGVAGDGGVGLETVNAVEGKRAAERALGILERMEMLGLERPDLIPDTIGYTSVICAYARSGMRDGGDKAEELLRRSLRFYYGDEEENVGELNREALRPDSITFNAVLLGLARQAQMEYNDENTNGGGSGNRRTKPRRKEHSTVDKNITTTENRVEALLQEMHVHHTKGDLHVRPCTISYNILLDMYAKTGRVEKTERLLEKMHRLHEEKGETDVRPDLISYNCLLYALAGTSGGNYIGKAEDLLTKMERGEEEYVFGGDKILRRIPKPSVLSYNMVIAALANRNKHDQTHADKDHRNLQLIRINRAKRAEAILTSMTQHVHHTANDINTQSTKNQSSNNPTMIRPDNFTFNSVINAWTKSGAPDAASHATRILDMMPGSGVQPDTISFTSVIEAWSKSRSKVAPERAEELLERMLAEGKKCVGVKPNRITFNNVINCWAQTGGDKAGEQSERLLLRMTELSEAGMPMVKPDIVTISTVINSWARSGVEGAAERAEQILNHIEGVGRDGALSSSFSLKANHYTYGSVLNAWAQSGNVDAAQRAHAVLLRMEKAFNAGNSDARPTHHSYNTVINAYAKSYSPSKAVEAESILQSMVDSYKNGNMQAKPNVISYSSVLNACAYTKGNKEDRREAFRIARFCLKRILDRVDDGQKNGEHPHLSEGPNNVVFRTFFLACANLIPPGQKRDALVRSVFAECCRHGMVDVRIIQNLRRAFSSAQIVTLFSNTENGVNGTHAEHLARGSIEFEDLPSEWRSNVTLHGKRRVR